MSYTSEERFYICGQPDKAMNRTRSLDKLFNVEALIPPRPTISNLQWMSGTSYVSPADMDKLSAFYPKRQVLAFLALSILQVDMLMI